MLRRLTNFKAIGKPQTPISRLRDFARSCYKPSYGDFDWPSQVLVGLVWVRARVEPSISLFTTESMMGQEWLSPYYRQSRNIQHQTSCKESWWASRSIVCAKSRSETPIDGLVQDCSISIANTLEILWSSTKPSIWDLHEISYPKSVIKPCISPVGVHYELHNYNLIYHDDITKRKRFPRVWPIVRGIHLWLVDSPHKVTDLWLSD